MLSLQSDLHSAGQAQVPHMLACAWPRVWGLPSLPQVCGSLGAGPLQLLPPPVHTVYLAGFPLPHPAEGTGTSEEPLWPPRFGSAVSPAGDRQREDAVVGSRRLRGGQEWQCSPAGGGGTRRGLRGGAAPWSPPGKGHLQRTVLPTTQTGETVCLGTGEKRPHRGKNVVRSTMFRSESPPPAPPAPLGISQDDSTESEAAHRHPLPLPDIPSPTRLLYGFGASRESR